MDVTQAKHTSTSCRQHAKTDDECEILHDSFQLSSLDDAECMSNDSSLSVPFDSQSFTAASNQSGIHSECPEGDSESDDLNCLFAEPSRTTSTKKKRIRTNRRLYPFPRIVKRDIRRMYPSMLANVMNSGDLSFLSSFLEEFASKRCQFIDYFPGSSDINLSWNRTFVGMPAVMQYFSSFWNSTSQAFIPDFHIKVRWAAIKQFLNQDHSELMCGLSFSATPIYDLSTILATLQPKCKNSGKQPLSTKKRKLSYENSNNAGLHKHTQTLYLTPDDENESSQFPLLTSDDGKSLIAVVQSLFQGFSQSTLPWWSFPPKSIYYEGMATFRLNDKCQIQSLEFGPEIQRDSTPSLYPGLFNNTMEHPIQAKKACVSAGGSDELSEEDLALWDCIINNIPH